MPPSWDSVFTDHAAEIICQLVRIFTECSVIVGTFFLETHISFLSFWDKLVKLLLVLMPQLGVESVVDLLADLSADWLPECR